MATDMNSQSSVAGKLLSTVWANLLLLPGVCLHQKNDRTDMWLTLKETCVTFVPTSVLSYKVKCDHLKLDFIDLSGL